MQIHYEAIDATDNLYEPQQSQPFKSPEDNYCFSLPNPQMQNIFNLSRHHHLQTINSTVFGPQLLQPLELRREPQEATDQLSLRNKLGLINKDNDESGIVTEIMPRNLHQIQEYSSAKKPFWNINHSAMDDNTDRNMSQTNVERDNSNHKTMRLFGELEAIYGHINVVSSENKVVSKKRKRKKRNAIFRSMTRFIESLAESVMAHQDRIHRCFLESIERVEREESVREEARRREVARARNREALARSRELARALDKEALIVSYLEKVTGQSFEDRTGSEASKDSMAIMEYKNSEEKLDDIENHTAFRISSNHFDPSCSSSSTSMVNCYSKPLVIDGFEAQLMQNHMEKSFTRSTPTSFGKFLEVTSEMGCTRSDLGKLEFEGGLVLEEEDKNNLNIAEE